MTRQFVVVTLMSVVMAGIFGCTFPNDDRIEETPQGNVDRTRYGGLEIKGELTLGADNVEHGALRLDLMQVAILSNCYDRLVVTGDEENILRKKTIAKDDLWTERSLQNEDSRLECERRVIRAELFKCMALKNLEISESVGIYEFETDPLNFEPGPGSNSLNYRIIDGNRKGELHKYRIPPVPAASKTVLYHAAQAALRKSGLEAATAMQLDWSNGSNKCIDYLASVSTNFTPPPLNMLLVGFNETITLFGETTRKLVQNELNVAASQLSKQPDARLAQELLWNAPINSHSSALNNLVSAYMPQPGHSFGTCTCQLSRPSQQKAVRILRQARLAATFDTEQDTPNAELVGAAIQKIYADLDPEIAPPSLETFLEIRGLTLNDFAVARRYLLQERDALERENVTDSNDSSRVFGLSESQFQHPPGYYLSSNAGLTQFCAVTGGMCPAYTQDGALQTVDYLRHIAEVTLIRAENDTVSLSHDHRRRLAAASMAASSLIGKKRLVFYRESGESYLVVGVQGVEAEDEGNFRVFNSPRAYRCAVQGSVDGAHCDEEYLVQHELQPQPPSPWVYLPTGSHAPMDPYIAFTFDIAAHTWSEPAFLVRYGGIGNSSLLAAFRADFGENGGIRWIPLPQNSTFGDLMQTASQRSEGSCGEPKSMCGDTGIDRDYIPPLESELTEDSDDYETSWKHYHNLARQAALEADRLAEDMVNAGLEMDLRTEQAIRDLEDICGDVVTLDPFDVPVCEGTDDDCDVVKQQLSENPSLQNCLPAEYGGGMEIVDYTVLGTDPVCVYVQTGGTRAPCACKEGDTCPRCPVAVSSDQVDPDGEPADQAAACENRFAAMDENDGWNASDYEFVYIGNTLNIFNGDQGTSTEETDPVCDSLDALGELVDKRNSTNPPTIGDYDKAIKSVPWLNAEGIAEIMKYVDFDVDLLHHYSLSFAGVPLWSTRHENSDDCPRAYPWRELTGQKTACVGDANDRPPLAAPDGNISQMGDWLYQEIADPDYANNRMEWGRTLFERLFILGVISQNFGRMRQAGYYYKDSGYPSADEYPNGDIWPGVPLRRREHTAADESLMCLMRRLYDNDPNDPYEIHDVLYATLVERDPNIAPCHHDDDDALYRFEYSIDYSMSSGTQAYTDFWSNLAGFFRGDYQNGSLWKMSSKYTRKLRLNMIDHYEGGKIIEFNEGAQMTWFEDEKNNNNKLTWPYQGFSITPDKLLDSLRLACFLKERMNDPRLLYTPSDGSDMPHINNKQDIRKVRDYIRNVSKNIHKSFERLIIANLPKTLVSNFKPGATQTLYPDFKGQNLDHLISIDNAMQDIASGALAISQILVDVSDILDEVYINKEMLDTNKEISRLETTRTVLADVAAGAQAMAGVEKQADFTGASWVAVAAYAVMAGLDIAIGVMKEQIHEMEENLFFKQSARQIRDKLKEMYDQASLIRKSFMALQSAANGLEKNGIRATERFAFALGLDGDEAGHVFHSNTVMRRRYNTLRERYENAFLRAKRLAFIARRAIEFRLGVDMSQMDDDMMLVTKPSSWADRICEMQGFDYRRLRSVTEDEDDPLFDPDLQETDSYANWYIGDYVRDLGDFVESYNIDYPFTDERDVAVLSLKNDIMRVRGNCEAESYNLLYHSGRVGLLSAVGQYGMTYEVGWHTGGCDEGHINRCVQCDPLVDENCDDPTCYGVDNCLEVTVKSPQSAYRCDDNFCFGLDPEWIDAETNPERGVIPALGTRIRDRPASHPGRTDDAINSGYVSQVIPSAPSGYYVLSFWASDIPSRFNIPSSKIPGRIPHDLPPGFPEGPIGPQPHPGPPLGTGEFFRVEFRQGGDIIAEFEPELLRSWYRHEGFTVNVPEGGDLEIRIYPSKDQDDARAVDAIFGDMLIWGAQLEYLPPGNGRCQGSSCLSVAPLDYQETDDSLLVTSTDCEDYDGDVMRSRFTYRCMCLHRESGRCEPEDVGSPYQKCFWEYPFTLTLDAVETSAAIPSNNVSVGNFNYRHEAMAVNLVGTNVVDCSRTESPSTCYANAFVNYTFEHRGVVDIRNHEHETLRYSMPTARIEHGKSLNAEVVVTNPMTSTHSSLLNDYWKDGLRGRPLQGSYYLRIWDSPGLVWPKLEDVQILWRYRYWTQMGSSY
jgi:hypothetical protein